MDNTITSINTVARFKDGSLRFYSGNEPVRDEDNGTWSACSCFDYADIDENLFPDLAWENDPITVDLVPVKTRKERMIQELKDRVVKTVMEYFDKGMDDHPLKSRQDATAEIRKNCMDKLCWMWQDYNDMIYDDEKTWDLNYDYEKPENV